MIVQSGPDGRPGTIAAARRWWPLVALAALGCTGTIEASGAGDPGAPPPMHAGGAGGAQNGGSGGGVGPVAMPAAEALVPAGMRRLTTAEYLDTVHDLLGSMVTVPDDALDRDDPSVVFGSVGSYRVATTSGGVVKYADVASSLADQVFADPARAAARSPPPRWPATPR